MTIFPDGSLAARIYAEIRDRLPRLPLSHDPGGAARQALTKLEVSDEDLLGGPIRDPIMARAVRSGLLLRADLNDESHTVSQDLKITTTQPMSVEAFYTADMGARVSGYVAAVLVDIGSSVKAGQPLLKIDAP